MERLYYESDYVKSFDAVVISCEKGPHGYEVILNRTGFYPEGGGQPGDRGFIKDVQVLDVQERQGEVIHYTKDPLEPGIKVSAVVDWDRRYANMQQHAGEHVMSGLIHRRFGYDNVGFHIGSDVTTMDFNGLLTTEQIWQLEQEANQVIYQNLPIRQLYPTKEELHSLEYRSKKELTGQVRIVEIPGIDVCACCGTHVGLTGEIGIIKILGMIHYKGGVRMTMLCGWKAVCDYERKQNQVKQISKLLSVKQEEIVEAVMRMRQEQGDKEFLINQLYQKLFQVKTDILKEQDGLLLIFEEGLSPVLLRTFCTMLYEQKKGGIVVVCSGEEGSFQYAMGSASRDMQKLSKELNAVLGGRGGGSRQMVQGTLKAARQEIESALLGKDTRVRLDGF